MAKIRVRRRRKQSSRGWKKIFANLSNKGLISKICKELL
jgi:hypothetical protein